MEEIWKNIKGYNGLYQISNLGNIYSLYTNKILKPFINEKGYLRIDLKGNGKRKIFKVHRLVAEHFINNPNNYKEVNHINGVKTDNRVENLEWCTRSHNMKEAVRMGLVIPPYKKQHL